MKRPSISFGEGGFKGWIIRHVEKLVLGVVVALAGLVIYQGWTLVGLDSSKSPDDLSSKSSQVDQTVLRKADTWTKSVSNERKTLNLVAERVESDLSKQTISDPYRLANAWSKPDFKKLSPRVDPGLLPPLHLKVVPFYGPLASVPKEDEIDPLTEPEKEEVGGKVVKPKPRPRPPAPRRVGSSGMSSMGSSMSMANSIPGTEIKGTKSSKGKKGKDEDLLGVAGMSMGMSSGLSSGMGMGAQFGAAPGSKDGRVGYTTSNDCVARPTGAVVVMAAVPFKDQFDRFQDALSNSLDYDVARDQPRYQRFLIERADVTDDPTADVSKLKWVPLAAQKALKDLVVKWDGFPAEVMEPAYLDPATNPGGVLTHPAPPFLERELWEALTHPDIPNLAPVAQTKAVDPRRRRATEEAGDEPETDDPSGVPMTGYPSSNSMMPGMVEGGSAMAGSMMPGMGSMGSMSMPGMGSMGSMGMPGMGGAGISPVLSKFKLVRFTDLEVEQGKVYRYRVRLQLIDPNNPPSYFKRPSVASLGEKVKQRIKTQAEADANAKTRVTTSWLLTDWSEPSEPVSLPATEWFYAGKVEAPKPSTIDGYNVPSSEIKGTALSVKFDPTKAVDVPAEQDVFRGSTLNVVKDLDITHPVTGIPQKLEKYRFRTNAVVLDIMGGETIPHLGRISENALVAPGEMLVFDSSGKLHVDDEALNIDEYRRYTDVKDEKPAAASGGGIGGMGVMPGMMGGSLAPPAGASSSSSRKGR